MTQVRKINGIPVVDTSISAFTYDGTNQFTIDQTDGVSFNAQILTLSATSISATTFYGDGSNLTGIAGGNNTYTTGMTFNNNTLTATNSTGGTYSTIINNFTGLTVSGSISATTYFGDGSNLTGIITTDSYITGTTFNDTIITYNRNNGLSAITTDLTGLNIETYFLKDSAGTINVGEVIFAKNWNDANSVVSVALADATSGGGTMPAIGICTSSGSSTVQGTLITNGTHDSFDTSAWGLNNALYVSETPGQLTNVRPTGDTADIQIIGIVLKVDAVSGVIAVYGAGRSNDLPNLSPENFWIGGADSIAVEKSVNDFTDIGTPASDDYLMIWDTDAATTKKVSWSGVSITTSANIGGGEGVFSAKVGTVNQFKSLTSSGATIAITTSGDTINFESIAGTGQDNTASNVGGETGLFKQKTGVDLEFKTLSAGTNIQIFSGDNVVTISGPAGSGEANTGSNLGGGNPVFKQKTGVDLEFRTLVAGTNVTITSGATELTINASGGGGGGTSRITGATQTTTATPGEIDVIDTLVDNATNIVEVFVKAYESGAAEYGVWKRTLTVTSVSGTVVIREENADVDKTSSGLNANSINFTVNGSNIDIDVTGIAATTIDWVSAYEIII
jgi:hypothetical protein